MALEKSKGEVVMTKRIMVCSYIAVTAVVALYASRVLAIPQGQQKAPQVPTRPHLDDPNYYDRDGKHDAPYAEKFKADAKAKTEARMKAALAKPTPHTADGHPNLNGIWVVNSAGLPVIISDDGKNRKVLFGPFDNGKPWPPVPEIPPDQPSYKSEYQAKVKDLWIDETHQDPTAYTCKEPGVPRMGEPDQIVQVPGQVIFLYKQGLAGGIPGNTFRVIPMDGRPHRTDVDPTAMGDSIGHWDMDTLVVDVTRLDDSTWFGKYGNIHTDAMHVVERFTRKGDTLQYTFTVDDPGMLTKPWTAKTVTRVLGGPDDAIGSDVPCVDNDSQHLTGLEHF